MALIGSGNSNSKQIEIDNGIDNLDLVTSGILTNSKVRPFVLKTNNLDIDNGGFSQVVPGFLNAGDFLALPPYPMGVTELRIVSTSVNDTLAGTGAQKINIGTFKLDGTLVEIPVNMNGTTPVIISAPDCVRLFSGLVQQTGASLINEGTISITDVSTTTDIYASIDVGLNWGTVPFLYIPPKQLIYMENINFSFFSSANDNLRVSLQSKACVRDFYLEEQTWILDGSSSENFHWKLGGEELTGFFFTEISPQENGMDLRFVADKLAVSGTAAVSVHFTGTMTLASNTNFFG